MIGEIVSRRCCGHWQAFGGRGCPSCPSKPPIAPTNALGLKVKTGRGAVLHPERLPKRPGAKAAALAMAFLAPKGEQV